MNRRRVLPIAFFSVVFSAAIVVAANGSGENLAQGKQCEFTRQPNNPSCRDSPTTSFLTDGQYVRGAGTIWTHPGTVGWENKDDFTVGIRIDLGESKDVAGFSLEFAAGAAGVAWPQLINVYVSEDGKSWGFVGDLYARSRRENGSPAMDGYAVYRAHSRSMPAKGRYVAFYIRTRGHFFCDEIEIYGGKSQTDGKVNVIGTPESHLQSYVLRNRLQVELDKLVNRSKSFLEEGRVKFDAEVTRLQRQVDETLKTPFDSRQPTIVPINQIHREILALNRIFLRRANIHRPTLWVSDRWENLDPVSVPDEAALAPTALEVEMMRGETRATAVNVANPMSVELECCVEVKGLPGSSHVRCHEVMFTDTKTGECVAGALRSADDGGKLTFRIPSGVSKQVWISFSKPKGDAGKYIGKVEASLSDGSFLEREIALNLHDVDFPERPTLHVHGWDYTYGKSSCYMAPDNLTSNLKMMREIFTDMPWAELPVLPQNAEFDKDGNLANESALDFRLWDQWVGRWSDARLHAVFLAANSRRKNGRFVFFDEPVGTARFGRIVGTYFRAVHGHYRKAFPTARLLLMPVDEPGGNWFDDNGEIVRLIVDWAKAIKAAVPEIAVMENPIYANPADGDAIFEVVDIISPTAAHFTDSKNASLRDYYLAKQSRGCELWLYSCSGPSRTMDPETYYRSLGWLNYQMGGLGMGFWAFGSGGGMGDSWHAYAQPEIEYSPYFVSPTETMPSKQSEGIREGVEDFEYLKMLEKAIATAEKRGRNVLKERSILLEAPKRALGQVSRCERPDPVGWNAAKRRGVMDRVRVEVLRALAKCLGASQTK